LRCHVVIERRFVFGPHFLVLEYTECAPSERKTGVFMNKMPQFEV
jgi:hypothetical protein